MSQGLYNLHSYHDIDYNKYDSYHSETQMTMNIVIVVVVAFVVAVVIIVVVVRLCLKHDSCGGCVADNDSMQDTLDEPDEADQELSSLDDHEPVASRLVLTMERHSHGGALLAPEQSQYDDNISEEINTATMETDVYSTPTLHNRLPDELNAITQQGRLQFLERGEDYDEDTLHEYAISNKYTGRSNGSHGNTKSHSNSLGNGDRPECPNKYQDSPYTNTHKQRHGNHGDEFSQRHIGKQSHTVDMANPQALDHDFRCMDTKYECDKGKTDDLCVEEYIFPSLDESLL